MSMLGSAFEDDSTPPDLSYFGEEEEEQVQPGETPAPAASLAALEETEPEEVDPEQAAIAATDDYPADAEFTGEQPDPQTTPEEDADPAVDEAEVERQKILGKFNSVEALETGYRQLQGEFTRREQAAAQERAANAARMQQQDELISGMFGILQGQLAESDPETAAQIGAWRQEQETQKRIQEAAQAEVAPLRQQIVQQQVQGQAQAAINQFYGSHPEIAPRGPEDMQMATTVGTLMSSGVPIDITNPQHLEVALAASRDPQYAFSMATAKAILPPPAAPAPAGGQPPVTDASGAPAQRQPVRRRVEAHVEQGGSGAPVPAAPGAKPKDPWGEDEFGDAARAYLEKPPSAIFGSRR